MYLGMTADFLWKLTSYHALERPGSMNSSSRIIILDQFKALYGDYTTKSSNLKVN
jgi:hypothetical protein